MSNVRIYQPSKYGKCVNCSTLLLPGKTICTSCKQFRKEIETAGPKWYDRMHKILFLNDTAYRVILSEILRS